MAAHASIQGTHFLSWTSRWSLGPDWRHEQVAANGEPWVYDPRVPKAATTSKDVRVGKKQARHRLSWFNRKSTLSLGLVDDEGLTP